MQAGGRRGNEVSDEFLLFLTELRVRDHPWRVRERECDMVGEKEGSFFF